MVGFGSPADGGFWLRILIPLKSGRTAPGGRPWSWAFRRFTLSRGCMGGGSQGACRLRVVHQATTILTPTTTAYGGNVVGTVPRHLALPETPAVPHRAATDWINHRAQLLIGAGDPTWYTTWGAGILLPPIVPSGTIGPVLSSTLIRMN